MKITNTLPKLAAIFIFIVALASCEEDFEPLVSNIGVQNFDSDLYTSNKIAAYSKKLSPVQTNALPYYQLGVYNDPLYGKSTVNLLSQVIMDDPDPDFGDSTELKSVYLYIPFFAEGTASGDETTYTLDSIYGSQPINIKIYESNYFLRDLDPNENFEELQRYYADQKQLFEDNLIDDSSGGRNFLTTIIEDFIPSSEEIIVMEDDDTTDDVDEEEKLPPGLRVELPVDFFKAKIIDKEGGPELINNNNFKEYFRGIYFEVTSDSDDGTLFGFDVAETKITLNYTRVVTTTSGDTTTSETRDETFVLSLGGVSVNVFDNELDTTVETALQNPDVENGEESLYVRGGDGIITVVDLFKDVDEKAVLDGVLVDGENGIPDELDSLRVQNWLVNEANLIFYVDQSKVTGGSSEPDRLVIFDINNGRLLLDYTFDTSSSAEPIDAKTEHLGRLDRGSDENGDFYKIRVTNHISNLIRKDSTNVSLGLMVSQNVLITDFQDLKDTQSPGIEKIPAASIISPEGTVLFGNNTTDQDKKLKLQIYYTKPD